MRRTFFLRMRKSRRDIRRIKTEFDERFRNPGSVPAADLDPEVDVARGPRVTVVVNAISAHEQVLNSVRVQAL